LPAKPKIELQKVLSITMRTILSSPKIFNLFSKIVGGNVLSVFVQKYIRPVEGEKILDIGCGTAVILSYLPSVEYFGLDKSQTYIKYARKRFGKRGRFLANSVGEEVINRLSHLSFDKVLAKGVLHHLNDDEASQLFKLAKSALKNGGRLITLDGCYMHGQSWIAGLILSKDRGKYVRTKDEYLSLVSKFFTDVHVSLHHDLLRIPYTHIVMECTA
jgi:SAM-dependent methyltransferase